MIHGPRTPLGVAVLALSIAVGVLAVVVLAEHPIEALTTILLVAPFTATGATWYIRRIYLSDRRVGADGRPLRSTFLRRAWRSAALVTVASYPIAAIAGYSLVRRVRPELVLPALPPGVGATVIAVGILAGLIVPHWLALAIWRDRRAPPGAIERHEDPGAPGAR